MGKPRKVKLPHYYRPLMYEERRPTAQRPTRSTTGAFSDDDTIAFLNNVWVPCRVSSDVHEARYDPELGIIELLFADASHYMGEISFEIAEGFAQAASKGGYVHDVLKPYLRRT